MNWVTQQVVCKMVGIMCRDAVKDGFRLREKRVKICFFRLQKVNKVLFSTQFHTTLGPPFRAYKPMST